MWKNGLYWRRRQPLHYNLASCSGDLQIDQLGELLFANMVQQHLRPPHLCPTCIAFSWRCFRTHTMSSVVPKCRHMSQMFRRDHTLTLSRVLLRRRWELDFFLSPRFSPAFARINLRKWATFFLLWNRVVRCHFRICWNTAISTNWPSLFNQVRGTDSSNTAHTKPPCRVGIASLPLGDPHFIGH